MLTAASFILAAVVTFYLWHIRAGREISLSAFLNHSLPWPRLRSHSTKVDAALYLISKLTQHFITIASAALTAGLAAGAARLLAHPAPHVHTEPGFAAIAVLGVAVFVCADFGDFLSHYLQHKIPLLWQFHRVHHSALFLTPLTSARFHPAGNLLDGVLIGLCLGVPASIAVALCHFTMTKVLAIAGTADLAAAILLMKALQHSHFNIGFGPLERIFISPRMHQLHHSAKPEHWDKNMASSLALWDWLFGTAFVPVKGEALTYGLGTHEDERGDYGSIVWCYLAPFHGSWKLLRSARPRRRPLPPSPTAEAMLN